MLKSLFLSLLKEAVELRFDSAGRPVSIRYDGLEHDTEHRTRDLQLQNLHHSLAMRQ